MHTSCVVDVGVDRDAHPRNYLHDILIIIECLSAGARVSVHPRFKRRSIPRAAASLLSKTPKINFTTGLPDFSLVHLGTSPRRVQGVRERKRRPPKNADAICTCNKYLVCLCVVHIERHGLVEVCGNLLKQDVGVLEHSLRRAQEVVVFRLEAGDVGRRPGHHLEDSHLLCCWWVVGGSQGSQGSQRVLCGHDGCVLMMGCGRKSRMSVRSLRPR